MPLAPPDNTAHRVSTETAEQFVKSFYRSIDIQIQRSKLNNYFHPEISDGAGSFPVINWNGSPLSTEAFQQMVEGLPTTRFEVEAFDAQTINPALVIEGRTDEDIKRGKNLSISVTVSGMLHIGPNENQNRRSFADTFILVPNPKAVGRQRGHKDWVIQVYYSRIVSS